MNDMYIVGNLQHKDI